jgi:polyhydroxyalkanoate synthesis repressor PhaR
LRKSRAKDARANWDLPCRCIALFWDGKVHGSVIGKEIRTGILRRRVSQAQARIHMSDPRVIKKYPNRRLYDTIESRYITLADVRRLVVERIDFVVVDKKDNADITRSILLQVISEQEHLSEPILSQEFMVNVIRAYGTNTQSSVSSHLEQTLRQFMVQQPQIVRERIKPFAPRPPDEAYKATLSPSRDASMLTK